MYIYIIIYIPDANYGASIFTYKKLAHKNMGVQHVGVFQHHASQHMGPFLGLEDHPKVPQEAHGGE